MEGKWARGAFKGRKAPFGHCAGEAADAGMDAYAPVTDGYDPWDNAFTGTINSVKVAHKA